MKQTPPAFVFTKQCNLLHDKCAAEQSFSNVSGDAYWMLKVKLK